MDKNSKLLLFRLSTLGFGIPLKDIKKVIQIVEITPLPEMPKYILGIINFHGEILPVINLSYLFNIYQKEAEVSDRMIIAKTKTKKLALVAQHVEDVIDIDSNDITSPEDIVYGTNFLQGVIKHDDGMILIADTNNFLNKEELEHLDEKIETLKVN